MPSSHLPLVHVLAVDSNQNQRNLDVVPFYANNDIRLYAGDCVEIMHKLSADSVDSVVTDPPAGIAFMNKSWDGNKGGRDAWITWLTEVMAEAYRVAKPGAHALVWALPRTSGWTQRAIEDAGWDVRDCITHIFGTGFPKSLDVGKAIDRTAGAEREITGQSAWSNSTNHFTPGAAHSQRVRLDVTAPATDAARQWNGWGTALKPAAEFWFLARKPLIGTVAANVQAHGTGAINVDGCRISPGEIVGGGGKGKANHGGNFAGSGESRGIRAKVEAHTAGRWPSNVLLTHAENCVEVGTRKVRAANTRGGTGGTSLFGSGTGDKARGGYADPDGTETVAAWRCVEGCPVAALDAQSGNRPGMSSQRHLSPGKPGIFGVADGSDTKPLHEGFNDSGGASRFFYQTKANARERPSYYRPTCECHAAEWAQQGFAVSARWTETSICPTCNELSRKIFHPTIKPLTLMAYLIRLITPPGGTVLDPFAGTGTTGEAAKLEGMRAILIEQDVESLPLIEIRMNRKPVGARPMQPRKPKPTSGGLFD